MRIVHESPELLIVAERAVGLRLAGAIVVGIGATFLVAGIHVGSLGLTLGGAIVFVVGALLVVLPASTTFSFSRGDDRFVVARRRMWDVGRGDWYMEYPLRDIAAARLDTFDRAGRNTWRVIVQLADGRTIPFTSYYTSGHASKLEIANRISTFLRLPAAAAPPSASPYAITRAGRRAMIGISLLFVVVGAAFAGLGGVMVAREYHRLSTWQPVQATVLGTHVDVNSDSDGETYKPVVDYRYRVGGQTYTSRRTLPTGEGRSGRWAYRVIARFNVGGTYTAWYDPADPSDAFIVRSRSIIAPVFTIIGLVAVLGGCAGVVSQLRTPAA